MLFQYIDNITRTGRLLSISSQFHSVDHVDQSLRFLWCLLRAFSRVVLLGRNNVLGRHGTRTPGRDRQPFAGGHEGHL